MPRKAEFPEIGDLVICNVQNVKNFGAFVSLDEYDGREGFIHVRDVATGWVKYIRDHVREGQKVVCKVLGVDSERGHIDLSLKQVNDHQRREKIQEHKNEKKAEKLLEIVGTKLGKSLDEAYDAAGAKLVSEFGTLYAAFEQAVVDTEGISGLEIGDEWVSAIKAVASENIQLPSVTIDATMEVTTAAPDGVDHIREALTAGAKGKDAEVEISYLGAPRYRITVVAEDYKIAETELKHAVDRVTTRIHKAGGSVSIKRKDET
ncbi:MAG: Translation initiation factor subunit alpha [Candidatus Thermoplasmatota archaeon]|nr:Translation initiation factor subunit alpha [Candidatus Thermoplasmatota archaeon]